MLYRTALLVGLACAARPKPLMLRSARAPFYKSRLMSGLRGLKGEVSPFGMGPTIGVDRSFSEGRDGLNVAGFINIWGRHELM